ncbi:hypothetical protein V3C99_003008 [Haemonchus contortus]
MIVTILGANSLLGQHLVQYIQRSSDTSVELNTWTYFGKFEPRLSGIELSSINHSSGLEALQNVVQRSDIVFNLHELQDLSLLPDKQRLWLHNVGFVKTVLSSIRCPLLHLSSVFLQCSSRWPNVFEGEADPIKYMDQWPFWDYCKSKYDAEELILSAPVNAYVMRCVPAYGEGDKCSVLTDLIKFASNGDIVSVGDSDGAFEMAYAGNLAEGLWNAALHLLSSVDIRKAVPHGTTPEVPAKSIKDTIILSDETPKKNIFPLFKPVLTTGKRNMIQCCIPFVPLFYIYYVVTLLVNVLSGYITMPMCIRKLPHPSVLYLCFRHWTFFNTKKSRLVLDYQPSIKVEEALNRCQLYYRHLQPQDIPSYSWSPICD